MEPDEQVGSEARDDDDGGPERSSGEEIDALDLQEFVPDVAETLLEHPFEGITSVERADDGGWAVDFEVVERRAVPDTQDIIGRYELRLSTTGDVESYSLQQRFKRSELQGEAL